MRKICFITGSRADYGIMSGLIKRVQMCDNTRLCLIATNMHLSPKHGMTIGEIEKDGLIVDYKVSSYPEGDEAIHTSFSFADTVKGIAEIFDDSKPDLVVILGDRYEILAAASVANIFNIPVAHIHGGEITEGAYDDSFRHAITKLSYLHFAATKEYAQRIIQMGESPERVFHTGAPGVENILNSHLLSQKELETSLNFSLGENYALLAFHPVTRQSGEEENQTFQIIKALDQFLSQNDYKFIITLPNNDTGGDNVASILRKWASHHPDRIYATPSLGRLKFYSALSNAKFIIGNSSAGIIEAPSFKIPTINIGDRQKGRVVGPSVLNCGNKKEEILGFIKTAVSKKFIDDLKKMNIESVNPYYKPGTSEEIFDIIVNYPLGTRKTFFDMA